MIKKIKNTLLIVIFVTVIISLSACSKYNFKYQKSVKDSFTEMKNVELFSIDKLIDVIITSDTITYQFVDIRIPHKFVNGHILNAVNVPLKSMNKNNCKVFCQKDKIFLIYGETPSQARIAYSYLTEMGFKNIYVVGGGYDFIENNIIEKFGFRSSVYDDEIARYDFAKVIAETSGSTVSNANTSSAPPPVVVVKKKKAGNVGGCE